MALKQAAELKGKPGTPIQTRKKQTERIKMTKAEKNAVAAAASTAVAFATDVPEWMKKGSKGSENVEFTDLILPRLSQVQALSPQIKKSDAAFIPGIEQGQLFNSVTGEIYGAEVTFIPVMFKKVWLIFKERKQGGGFFGSFDTEVEAQKAVEAIEDNKYLEVIESHEHIGVVLNSKGEREQVVFSCTKSKISVSRKLNTLVTMAGVDRFAKAYQITSVDASNAQGEDYFNVGIKALGFVSQDVYAELDALYERIKDVKVGADYSDEKAGDKGGKPGKGSAADEKEF